MAELKSGPVCPSDLDPIDPANESPWVTIVIPGPGTLNTNRPFTGLTLGIRRSTLTEVANRVHVDSLTISISKSPKNLTIASDHPHIDIPSPPTQT